MKKTICIILIASIFLPILALAQINTETIKEKTPGILESWWNSVKSFFFGKAKDIFLNAVKNSWNFTINIWRKMGNWFVMVWNNYIRPRLEWLWGKILLLPQIFQKKK